MLSFLFVSAAPIRSCERENPDAIPNAADEMLDPDFDLSALDPSDFDSDHDRWARDAYPISILSYRGSGYDVVPMGADSSGYRIDSLDYRIDPERIVTPGETPHQWVKLSLVPQGVQPKLPPRCNHSRWCSVSLDVPKHLLQGFAQGLLDGIDAYRDEIDAQQERQVGAALHLVSVFVPEGPPLPLLPAVESFYSPPGMDEVPYWEEIALDEALASSASEGP